MPSKKKDGMIWFSCEGENPADRENIGPIKYYPDPGVPTFFYPYKNQDGYHSPAVFAHFEDPKRKQFSEMYIHTLVACMLLKYSFSSLSGLMIQKIRKRDLPARHLATKAIFPYVVQTCYA